MIVMIGVIGAMVWCVLLRIVLALCQAAAQADAIERQAVTVRPPRAASGPRRPIPQTTEV